MGETEESEGIGTFGYGRRDRDGTGRDGDRKRRPAWDRL
ncbi:hypothetical protein KNP414_03637 [Paenibacillus mucilaginosus KNP414]|uniref:Uncharacterized protein n=1 Tax=Paenibacillus mucilaginosus (strain KNP414) TaxID=1036673 RepID=F8FDL1_PAEMK|nr:hypothetical protein KNP414_03637 [Paenibacillus mucilaginosus KNP414]